MIAHIAAWTVIISALGSALGFVGWLLDGCEPFKLRHILDGFRFICLLILGTMLLILVFVAFDWAVWTVTGW